MAIEIKRKAELSLVGLLGEMLPNFDFYPSKGGYEDGGVTLPTPPFGAVWIDNAEKTIGQELTYLLTGTVVWVTRANAPDGSGDVADHSDSVKQIYDAMQSLAAGGADPDRQLMIHGMDISLVDEFSDAERLAHGDTISFTMGATELD
jgi:hypothetical protein